MLMTPLLFPKSNPLANETCSVRGLIDSNMSGVDTRNITVADIESVEVITGVPSAEYGDLNSGMVKIHTRKGKTPWNILLSINPRTEQVSFAKGLI